MELIEDQSEDAGRNEIVESGVEEHQRRMQVLSTKYEFGQDDDLRKPGGSIFTGRRIEQHADGTHAVGKFRLHLLQEVPPPAPAPAAPPAAPAPEAPKQ
jgi:hypothetical protein